MKRLFTLIMLLAVTLVGCGERTTTRSSFMMDTVITYTIKSPVADKIIDECEDMTAEFESIFSAYLDTSLVSEFNRVGMIRTIDNRYFEEVLFTAISVFHQTNGAFDITVAPLVKAWDISHAGDDWTPLSDAEISSMLPHVGMDKLTFDLTSLARTDDNTEIDLGGIAKGYALGAVAEYIKDNYSSAVGTVSFGGNIALIGQKDDGTPWNVGIRDPFSADSVIGTLSLDGGIVSVSGGYERYAEYNSVRYHHIINPETGSPAETDLASVAVWVDTTEPFSDASNAGAYADALSTALFIMGHDAALAHYEKLQRGELSRGYVNDMTFEAVLIGTDGTITLTSGLEGRFTAYEKNE